jgi:hypothetical protein
MKATSMKLRLLLPAVAVLVMAACAPAPVLRNEKWLHDNSLVTGDPCESPCWNGITPGETSWSDAIAIIENDSTFVDLQTENAEQGPAKGASWRQVDGEPCCDMFTEDGETVDSMLLRLAPDVKLGEVVEAHGDPTYVVGTEVTADQAVMNLFYTEPPMLIYVFVAGRESGALSENSEVIGALYMTSDTMQQLIEANSLYAWQGYQSYATYAAARLAVTAVPTSSGTPTEEPEATEDTEANQETQVEAEVTEEATEAP